MFNCMAFFLADFYNVCRERVCEESRVSERVSLQVANDAPFMVYLAFRGKSVSPRKIR